MLGSVLVGCPAAEDDPEVGGTTGTSSVTTETSTATETGTPLPEGCECPASEACGIELCPEIILYLHGAAGGDTDTDTDTDGAEDPYDMAIGCALEAMQTGATGTLRWFFESEPGFGTEGTLQLFGDGTALQTVTRYQDLVCDSVPAARHGLLHDAAHFETCAAESDRESRFDCFEEAFAEITTECQAAVTSSCGT
jgi:hypothetical protein